MDHHQTTLIFDLDGTLIDSSVSILDGFAAALAAENLTPAIPLTSQVIGPPLKQTLSLLTGATEEALLQRLIDRFKDYYDTAGYRRTTVFPGVDALLATLTERGIPAHIATNKRLLPTRKIIAHLGWSAHFRRVAALDAWTPPARDKAEMIRRLISELALAPQDCLYVGDRQEDAAAAAANAMPFAFAAWGYGEAPEQIDEVPLRHPDELLARLAKGRPHVS